MWVIYKKSEQTIVSLSANGGLDPDKHTALKEAVDGLVKKGQYEDYDAIQVTDPQKADECMDAFPERLVITGTRQDPKVTIRDPEVFSLFITIDAPEKHPVDGTPGIVADGKSSVLISLTKMDERFKPQRTANDNDELFFRTDHGTIRDEEGVKELHSIKLKKGEAKIRLFSEKVKRLATMEIMSVGSSLQDRKLRVEFI
ncbi:MAG: hypothetical protein OEY80_09655 [Nitrospirota bacterium]|nr:hypothetical protein [Nitrospirota bacterium]